MSGSKQALHPHPLSRVLWNVSLGMIAQEKQRKFGVREVELEKERHSHHTGVEVERLLRVLRAVRARQSAAQASQLDRLPLRAARHRDPQHGLLIDEVLRRCIRTPVNTLRSSVTGTSERQPARGAVRMPFAG